MQSTRRLFSEAQVLLARSGHLQRVTINRPKALNALNQQVVDELSQAIPTWSSDDSVSAVLIRGAGEAKPAFCAGGDVKALANGTYESQEHFFRTEYRLDYSLAVNGQKQPHVVVYHGAVMGGGVGISIHAPIRVATERAVFAMPETALGLFPDVGGSFFLPRLPKRFGHYLGLVGSRLTGADMVHAGIATHFIPSDRLPAFEAELAAALDAESAAAASRGAGKLSPSSALEVTQRVADAHAVAQCDLPSFPVSAEALQLIEWAFGQPSVEGVVKALKDHAAVTPAPPGGAPPAAGSALDVALRSVEALSKASPLSLKVTHEQLRRGVSLSLAQCFAMELRIATRFMRPVGGRRSDFFEGVRSILVDRDNTPQWSPPSLGEVPQALVDEFFAPMPCGKELQLE